MMSESTSERGSPDKGPAIELGAPIVLASLPPVLDVRTSPEKPKPANSGTTTTSGAVPMFNPAGLGSGATLPPPVAAGTGGGGGGAGMPPGTPPPAGAGGPLSLNEQFADLVAPTLPVTPGGRPAVPGQSEVPAVAASWFYKHESGAWSPFSRRDSQALEEAHGSGPAAADGRVRTDGGRFEVDVARRQRHPVFWSLPANTVTRGTWFIRDGPEVRPISESESTKLEAVYQRAWAENVWHQRVDLADGSYVALRNESLHVLYPAVMRDPSVPEVHAVYRGFAENIEAGEIVNQPVDHLALVIPGPVAAHPNLSSLGYKCHQERVGTIIDCVDTLRQTTRDILRTHFSATESSKSSGRVEYLPVVWDHEFQAGLTSLDQLECVSQLSLPTIRRVRAFLTETMMGSLAYSFAAQGIVDRVAAALERVVAEYRARNPEFKGTISICGYGVGGCAAFDILHRTEANVPPPATDVSIKTAPASSTNDPEPAAAEEEEDDRDEDEPEADPEAQEPGAGSGGVTVESFMDGLGLSEFTQKLLDEDADMDTLHACGDADLTSLGFNLGKRKKILTALKAIQSEAAEAKKAAQLRLEQAKADRAQRKAERRLEARTRKAQRAEQLAKAAQAALASAQASEPSAPCESGRPPVVYSPKLSFPVQSLFLMGCPLPFLLTLRGADAHVDSETALEGCESVYNVFHPYDPLAYRLEPLIDADAVQGVPPVLLEHHRGRKRIHLELEGYLRQTGQDLRKEVGQWADTAWSALKNRIGIETGDVSSQVVDGVAAVDEVPQANANVEVGRLNQGRRLDHALQEAPFEVINEARFALRSHTSYWASEDFALFLATKMYSVGS